MQDLKLKKQHKRRGITLMELIVVIVISSLIAGTFATVFYRVTNSDLSDATEAEMERIKTALLEFYQDVDQFPKDTNAVTTDFLDLERVPLTSDRFYGTADTKTWRLNHWDGPYIQDKFNDNGYMKDAWQNDYVYDYTYGNDYCVVTSYGPDRTAGGGDDIVIRANARSIKEDKIKATQDELNIIQLALNDYVTATGTAPSTIDDLFDWEVLNLHMDEASWTGAADEVVDTSGEGNHGTAYGGATTTASGKVGRAGSFDGTGDYVDCGSNSITGTNVFTLEAWVKPSTVSKYSGAISIGASAGGQSAYIGTVSTAQVGASNSIGGGFYGRNYGSGVTTVNKWFHVVMTFDGGASGTAKIYINGVEKVTDSYTPNLASTYRRIGRICSDTGYDFNGLIDEVRIYSVALSADEILRHYENPGYPRDYFDLHDKAFKYDEWETPYALGSTSVGGNTVYYFYSYGPDKVDDSGANDDIKPLGLP